jgi:hypothetical protein
MLSRFFCNGSPCTGGNDGFFMLILVPLTIVSESNLWENRWQKSARRKKYTEKVQQALKGHKIPLPCEVTLTRIAPRSLDDDNLVSAMKKIRDLVADHIIPGLAPGRADGDPRITWKYAQERGKPGEYGLKIEVKNENSGEVGNG